MVVLSDLTPHATYVLAGAGSPQERRCPD